MVFTNVKNKIMKKIIVTGGLGFIGSNLIELLLKKNFSVINIDKVTYSSNFYNTHEFSKSAFYKFIKCNLNNKSKLSKIIFEHKPLCIFNLAAETHVDRSIDSPESFIKSNILGVFNLLEIFRKYSKNNKNKLSKIIFKYKPVGIFNLAAETHVDRSIDSPESFINSNIVGVFNLLEIFRKYSKSNKKTRLIHISTDEVYGDILKGRSHENFPYKPSSPYAASKAASDHLVSSYVRTFKIPAIITNCSNNYGPKQHPEKLIPKLIYNILNNKSLPIYGNGKNSREWIYVQDHCEALIKVFQKF